MKVGFNLRELDAQYDAGIEKLTTYIMSGGILPPLEVVPLPDGSGIELVDGHRRYEAYGRAIARGFPTDARYLRSRFPDFHSAAPPG